MSGNVLQYSELYTPVGDVLVVAICLVFYVIVHTAYIKTTKNFRVLVSMIGMVFVAAICNMLFYISLDHVGSIPRFLHYIPRSIVHMCLLANLWMYVLYAKEPLHVSEGADRAYMIAASAGYGVALIFEVIGPALGFGYHIDDNLEIHPGFPIFPIAYIYFISILAHLVYKNRNQIYKKIMAAIIATIGISLTVILVQLRYGQTSFTIATFLFPIYALLYLAHSNPYDLESGAVGSDAFEDLIRDSFEHNKQLLLMSLYLPDFDKGGKKYPQEIMGTIRYFVMHFFKGATLFQLSGGHMILAVNIRRNPDYQYVTSQILKEFKRVYPRYMLDYKIVVTETWEKISEANDYSGFIDFLHDHMRQNSIYRAEVKDVQAYLDNKFIISQLEDIQKQKDLKDPRVLVYCQPVYNIMNGQYDTAEALMRLELPELGLVYPDKFIPIAEKNNYIQTLTQIILSKTCREIRNLTDKGYIIRRISVNFSIFDVRDEDFCNTVEHIIRSNGISFDKIAIEITETQSENDFEMIKDKINELKDSGIKFYLDDFGTGYSNFERIMELPFDIIKFDRSMVTGSGNDTKFQDMVTHLASMFNDMNYAVLYEGVENEADETRCINMSAKYLQGYKYSKPVPIEKLEEFCSKSNKS